MATKAEVKLPPSTPLSLNWLLQTQQAVKTNTNPSLVLLDIRISKSSYLDICNIPDLAITSEISTSSGPPVGSLQEISAKASSMATHVTVRTSAGRQTGPDVGGTPDAKQQ